MLSNIALVKLIKENLPIQWYRVLVVLLAPILWIFPVQSFLIRFTWGWGDSNLAVVLTKRVLLFLPSILVIVGCWCSMVSLYTLIFRPARHLFLQIIFLTWWDSGRSIWMFWAGIFRFLLVLAAWLLQFIRMLVSSLFVIIKQLIVFPFNFATRAGSKYFQPGVPWIAVILTFVWVTLEAAIFTYVLTPTLSEVLSDVVGVEDHRFFTPMLFLFLFLLVSGSFACIQVLKEAVESRNIGNIIQMLIMEMFVMFLEVVFLYRELVDSISPWIYQQTGRQLGLVSTILMASFGWIGISLMNWFLFGRFGTPTLLAIIARKPIRGAEPSVEQTGLTATPATGYLFFTHNQMDMFKREGNWFSEKGKELLEALTIPPLQVLAAMINFIMVLISSRPLFNLPFRNLKEALDTKELLRMVEDKRESTLAARLKKAKRNAVHQQNMDG